MGQSGIEGIPFSSLMGEVLSSILRAFMDLVFSALEDDPLGVQAHYFEPDTLYDLAQKEGGTYIRSFHFDNSDDTGTYQTRYEWKVFPSR